MSAPPNINALRAMTPGPERIRAADDYIAQREEAIRDARRIRDDDIRALVAEHGPAEAARRSGRSLSTVKLVKGR